jgi:FAD synthase
MEFKIGNLNQLPEKSAIHKLVLVNHLECRKLIIGQEFRFACKAR